MSYPVFHTDVGQVFIHSVCIRIIPSKETNLEYIKKNDRQNLLKHICVKVYCINRTTRLSEEKPSSKKISARGKKISNNIRN